MLDQYLWAMFGVPLHHVARRGCARFCTSLHWTHLDRTSTDGDGDQDPAYSRRPQRS